MSIKHTNNEYSVQKDPITETVSLNKQLPVENPLINKIKTAVNQSKSNPDPTSIPSPVPAHSIADEKNLSTVIPNTQSDSLASYIASLGAQAASSAAASCSALLFALFPDPKWVKDKFNLSVKNIFSTLRQNIDFADLNLNHAQDDLTTSIKQIFKAENAPEIDPRTNHSDFITNLRAVLDSPIFKTALANTKLENNPNPPEHNRLVEIVLEICRIRFEEGYFYDFFNDTLNEIGLNKAEEVKLKHDDFKKLDNLKPEHQMSQPDVILGKAQGHFNINFDPHIKGNIPYVIATLNVDGKEIKLIRTGTPTIEGYLNDAEIISEFKGYLESLLKQGKNHLYISLQNDQPKMPGTGDESGRNRAIKKLQKEYKNFFVVILSQDSRFYKQQDGDGKPLGPQQSDEFLLKFQEEMFGNQTGFYFPQAWKDDPKFTKNINELLKFVHKVIFNEGDQYQSKELSREERLDFIEIFYAYLSVYLMQYSKADNVNGSCKDAIDRGGKLNSLILQLFLIIANKANDKSYQRVHQVFTHMAAMWTKGRAILHGRRDRLQWAYDRMCGRMERIHHFKLSAFDHQGNGTISLIDPKQAIRFECDSN